MSPRTPKSSRFTVGQMVFVELKTSEMFGRICTSSKYSILCPLPFVPQQSLVELVCRFVAYHHDVSIAHHQVNQTKCVFKPHI